MSVTGALKFNAMFSDNELYKNDGFWQDRIENNLYALNKGIISEKQFVNNILEVKNKLCEILKAE